MFRVRTIRLAGLLVLAGLVIMPATSAIAGPLGAAYVGSCTGEYFNNTDLSGSPVMTRTDGAINFFWPENSSPAGGINANNYSVRWTCSVSFPASDNYTFTTTTDDGMNVLVDGNLILWAFWDQGSTTYYPVTYINSGVHTVRVEYYNRWNAGTARVYWSQGGVPTSGTTGSSSANWNGEYFNNQSLSGSPVFTRSDSSINFDWGTGSPDGSVSSDHFSARWTATPYFGAGTWHFNLTADDGARLWVDSNLLIDRWNDSSGTTNGADMSLGAGNHTVRVEYYDNVVNAKVSLGYYQVGSTGVAPAPPPPVVYSPPPVAYYPPGPVYYPPIAAPAYASTTTGVWHGQYFSNVSLSGSPALTRDDSVLNFNWGEGSPGAGIPVDFSARWDSVQNAPVSDNYTISAIADDGVRVWVDGALVIDAWYDHGPTTFTATRYLTAGAHNVRVEYYDSNLGAVISVQIIGSGGAAIGVPLVPGAAYPGSATTGVWHGQYYNNIWLTGTAAVKKDSDTLNYNWGEGSPFRGVNKDFSAKWDSVQNAPYSGNYLISAASDDGVRVYIDGALVIDAWFDHLPLNFTATRYLSAGSHNVHVDYYDSGYGAMINVSIVGQ
jgi:PA14 domain-containing protein